MRINVNLTESFANEINSIAVVKAASSASLSMIRAPVNSGKSVKDLLGSRVEVRSNTSMKGLSSKSCIKIQNSIATPVEAQC